ncbi:winged helix-turn-helix domain-containing protein [Dinoroseobacter sp. S76]|uniref:winged helix-turn-helix domain-containing protein n=1 Tax=Dinoroseobacter sp. S76 TaxID=3415124 RepID=UPI003C7EBBAE
MAEHYLFDDFRLDLQTYGLSKNGAPITMEPLIFDLLLHFARNPGRVLSRDDLIDAVWEGRFVSDSTVSTAIKMVRKALGDTGEAQRYIQTLRGRGFQFAAEVTHQATPAQPVKIPVQPALAILVSSPDDSWPEAQTRLLASRLRTVLARVPLLRISTRAETDLEALAGQGVSHLVEVSVTESAGEILADARLVDTGSGYQQWARSFDLASTQGVREVLLFRIVAQLEPALMRALIDTFSGTGPERDPQAMVIEAIGTLATWGWNRASFKQARGLLDQALAQDGQNAMAHAYSALLRALAHRVGTNRDPAMLELAKTHAEAALEIETQDSFVLGIAGCALCDAGQLDRGLPILYRSAQLNDSNGHALTAIGAALLMRGAFEEASEKLREGIAISPADSRLAVWEALLAMTEMACGRIEAAVQTAESAMSRDDRNYLSRLAAAAIRAAMQDAEGLSRMIAELLRVHPELTEEEVGYFVGPDLRVPLWAGVEAARAAMDPVEA